MDEIIFYVIVGAVALIVGVLATVLGVYLVNRSKKKKSKKEADSIISEANSKADRIRKTAELDAKQIQFEARQKAENDARSIRGQIQAEEQKLAIRQGEFDKRENELLEKEKSLDEEKQSLETKSENLAKKENLLDEKIDSVISELEKISGMSVKQAHDEIMNRVEGKMEVEIATYMKNKEDEARESAQAKAIDLLSLACAKYAQDVASERTVTVVTLPNDDMKSRIIGRQGRNIQELEKDLGVDLVIDDTPEAITVSCFDPIRREVAKLTLETLIRDGRIQPVRIEAVAEKMKKEVEDNCRKYGEDAVFKLGLSHINKELFPYIGRLHYRTSYGQNALDHSMEVAYLTGIMAAELGLNEQLAKRAGLLHDIGKSVDFEVEGSHVELGSQLAHKYGESDVVINAIESHHGDVEAKYVISHLVAAADTLSAARPGARSEILTTYVKRIEELEKLAKSHDGVSNAYAMQSGRELRVMVIPEKVSDEQALLLSRQIKDEIEQKLTYPGQIKVSIIREYRAIETAK